MRSLCIATEKAHKQQWRLSAAKKKKTKHFNGKRKSKAKEEIQKVHFNPHNKNLIYLGYKKLLQSNKKREIEN